MLLDCLQSFRISNGLKRLHNSTARLIGNVSNYPESLFDFDLLNYNRKGHKGEQTSQSSFNLHGLKLKFHFNIAGSSYKIRYSKALCVNYKISEATR